KREHSSWLPRAWALRRPQTPLPDSKRCICRGRARINDPEKRAFLHTEQRPTLATGERLRSDHGPTSCFRDANHVSVCSVRPRYDRRGRRGASVRPMAAAARLFPVRVPSPSEEQRILLTNVPWSTYVVLRDGVDSPGVRMTYLKGWLEIMSPSKDHE